MSRIDELIAEFAPGGVHFKLLADCVVENLGGGTPSKAVSEFWGGTIPWASVGDITQSVLALTSTRQAISELGLQKSSSNLIPAGWVIAAVKIAPGELRVLETPVAINQDIRGLRLADDLDPYFLAYYFKTVSVVGNGTIVKGITNAELGKIRIPVPPLEVQREIVRILDQFTQLEARRRQYEHYRDQLLTFREAVGVRWIPMGELGTIFRGKRFTKADYVAEGGIGVIHYGEIYTHYGVSASRVKSRVRSDMGSSLRYATKGDVVLTDVGETVVDVGKAVAWVGEEDVAIHDHCYVIRSGINATYLAYVMSTAAFTREKGKHIARTKVKTLLLDGLKRIVVPIPSLDEQERIVEILDKFDALVNDLSIGLPAELAARRKQYEYYRDRLLTFKEAV